LAGRLRAYGGHRPRSLASASPLSVSVRAAHTDVPLDNPVPIGFLSVKDFGPPTLSPAGAPAKLARRNG
jgi:hypothetical protein